MNNRNLKSFLRKLYSHIYFLHCLFKLACLKIQFNITYEKENSVNFCGNPTLRLSYRTIQNSLPHQLRIFEVDHQHVKTMDWTGLKFIINKTSFYFYINKQSNGLLRLFSKTNSNFKEYELKNCIHNNGYVFLQM